MGSNTINYQKELDRLIEKLTAENKIPRLFLHSCCAPCSSYVLEYLREFFRITVFYYNPNISMKNEYLKRAAEQKRLIAEYNRLIKDGLAKGFEIGVVEGDYAPQEFYDITKGLEHCPEGGERCFRCYELRLRETARRAVAGGFDYFATTLTISPLKNAQKLNEIGKRLSEEYSISWLPSDFKKKNGYKRSIELSAEYGLYRQNYCGCVYSKKGRE